MASVVAHIIYAEKYFEKYPSSEINKDEFILGCVFPDIRRVDKSIKRKETHLCFDPIDLDFDGLTSFQAGWKFHLYCDMRREAILNKYDFYSLDDTTDLGHQPAKGLEDEIVYDDYKNWEKIVNYFNNPPEVSNLVGVSPASTCGDLLSTRGGQETIELWYAIIARYIEKKPDSKAMKIFLSKQLGFADTAGNVAEVVDKLRKDGKVIEALNKVKEEIV
ncbi:MAG TPA: hypothetical protein ENH35_02395 [Candidatus Moranbacteria bacterium]|nr:hypothetical protein [Candidatus Moranbacteria bacterium]